MNEDLTRRKTTALRNSKKLIDYSNEKKTKMLKEDLSIIAHLDDIEASLKAIPFNERFYNEYQKNKH